ncbi:MAG: hypothetical protein ACI33P_15615 [Lysinibacillus sp.]
MKKIYTLGLALCLMTACSSEQESVSPNVEQNANAQDDNIRLADAMNGSYHTALIDEYKDSEKVTEQIALFGEDLEQFLKVLEETTLIREPLPVDRPFLKEHHHIMLMGDGSGDLLTINIEEENGEQLVSLPSNDIIPSGLRKATNTDILKSIEAIKASEE